jgi:tetratricopeptide (TPR) repeat protein
VQLIDGGTERHVWARIYERDVRDVLTLQGEVARAVADEIQINLTPEQRLRLSRVRPVNPGVYDAYLRGRHYWYLWSEDAFRKGLESFQKAVQQDPGFAPAYAGLADCWMGLGFTGRVQPKEAFPHAMAAASRALALDEELAEAHISIGYIKLNYEWDWPSAAKAFQRALTLNRGLPEAHHAYAYYLRIAKRPEEVLAEMTRAWELDPLSSFFTSEVGAAYRWMGQYDQAIEWQLRALELDPDVVGTYAELGLAYSYKGMFPESITAIKKAIALSKGDQTVIDPITLAHAYARSGEKHEAQKLIRQWRERSGAPGEVAATYGALGMRDEAFAWLEKAYSERDGQLIFLNVDSEFEPLRSDPRFQALARRVGLPE